MRLASRGVMWGTVVEAGAALDLGGQRQRVHPQSGQRVGVDIDGVHRPVTRERLCSGKHRIRVGPLGRVELDDTNKFAGLELGGEAGLRATATILGRLEIGDDHRCGDPRAGFEATDGFGDRPDVLGAGSAATADERRAELDRQSGKPGQIRGGRRRHVDPTVTPREHTRVRQRRQGQPGLVGVAQNLESPHGPGRAVDTDGEQIEIGELVHHRRLLGVLVGRPLGGEGQETDQRQIADLTNRPDRQGELVKTEKGLEHEQIGAPPRENLRLFCMGGCNGRRSIRLVEIDDPRQRPDGAGDQTIDTGDLARLTGQLDRRRS